MYQESDKFCKTAQKPVKIYVQKHPSISEIGSDTQYIQKDFECSISKECDYRFTTSCPVHRKNNE